MINVSYMAQAVMSYINESGSRKIGVLREESLLGTAGTLRTMLDHCTLDKPLVVIHADNYSDIDLEKIIYFHQSHSLPMTLCSFDTDRPENCGVLLKSEDNVLTAFYEKVESPPSSEANGAIYVFEPTILKDILSKRPWISDISSQLIPLYIGQCKIYRHEGFLIDIGTIDTLREAQLYFNKNCCEEEIPLIVSQNFTFVSRLIFND